MVVTTHDNGMWGVIVWSGDVDGHAALLTSSRLGVNLWVYKFKKKGWFNSDNGHWDNVATYKDKAEAFKKLKVAGKD